MSRATKEINRITGTIIGISGRLIVYTLVVILLYEGVTKGYEFGYDIFYATSMEAEPGRDKDITVREGTSVVSTAKLLKSYGLINNEYSFIIQSIFFDYEVNPGTYTVNTSMTSKEILQMMNENTGEEETQE